MSEEQPRAGRLSFSSWTLLVGPWLLDTSGDIPKGQLLLSSVSELRRWPLSAAWISFVEMPFS
ncbi:hypothetical protein PVOR_25383 [Paenibacillus vortex V453]|uniref:Uncharacterized protein n=1 Tax=Paenibacillus vortex V453 TaxID=715225 RepID=A0A2R9SPT3_9BACL|nr:hypothetical protein PVOR_25383 [Paenibacillus vortex V453]